MKPFAAFCVSLLVLVVHGHAGGVDIFGGKVPGGVAYYDLDSLSPSATNVHAYVSATGECGSQKADWPLTADASAYLNDIGGERASTYPGGVSTSFTVEFLNIYRSAGVWIAGSVSVNGHVIKTNAPIPGGILSFRASASYSGVDAEDQAQATGAVAYIFYEGGDGSSVPLAIRILPPANAVQSGKGYTLRTN